MASSRSSHDAMVTSGMQALLMMQSVSKVDAVLLRRTLEPYERDRLDFAQPHLVALAESTKIIAVASYEHSIDRVKSMHRVES
jgi:hypothetical protein